jgi:hypothetical protein
MKVTSVNNGILMEQHFFGNVFTKGMLKWCGACLANTRPSVQTQYGQKFNFNDKKFTVAHWRKLN